MRYFCLLKIAESLGATCSCGQIFLSQPRIELRDELPPLVRTMERSGETKPYEELHQSGTAGCSAISHGFGKSRTSFGRNRNWRATAAPSGRGYTRKASS
jgi:hypothetical protein